MLKRMTFIVFIFLSFNGAFAQAPVQPTANAHSSEQHQNITAILGAFPPEVNIIRTQIKAPKDTFIENIRFTTGIINGRKIVLAQTGIGKVNAASASTLTIEHFHPAQVIFSGIAGGVNPALHPGDLVIATRVAHHDYGTITPDSMLFRKTRNPFTMQENPDYFPCDSNLVKEAVAASKKVHFHKVWSGTDSVAPQVIRGTIVTGDVFVASGKATEYLRTRLNADATEMEGAAVGQICWQQGTPFIVIRSLSDNANNTASLDVKTFYQVAANNSAALVMAIVGMINKE